MKKIILLTSLLFISATPIYCASSVAGTATAVFLRIPQGARSLGMGGAFVAMDKDVESVWWNPAALTFTDGTQANFSYSSYIADLGGSYATLSVPVGANKTSSFIADVNYISMGTADGRDMFGATTKTLNLNNLAGGIGYSFPTASNISFGVHAKYIQQNLGEYSSTGFAIDTGCLFRFSKAMNFGVSIQNLGQKMKTSNSDASNALPLTTRAGVAYLLSPKLTITVDEELPSDSDNVMHIGGELKMSDSFFLRAGYNTSEAVGVCAGVGFLTPITVKTQTKGAWWKQGVKKDLRHNVIRLDYAYISSSGNFDSTHRISATLKF